MFENILSQLLREHYRELVKAGIAKGDDHSALAAMEIRHKCVKDTMNKPVKNFMGEGI